jgi:xanthine/uracil/vitamin C permease (AzgA family)
MQRNVVRFAVVVAMVLAAIATGIGLGFGLYYFFKPIHGAVQQSELEPASTIRLALD